MLIYITSKKFPSAKADPYYVQSMAHAFAHILKKDFLFLIRGTVPLSWSDMHVEGLRVPKRFRIVSYFFLLPFHIFKKGWYTKETTFLSYDPNLLTILIFWRKVFRFSYHVASDWHQLFDNWQDAYVSKNSDYLITTSKRLQKLLIEKCHISSNNIITAYGGVSLEPFLVAGEKTKESLKDELSLPRDRFLVGYVGGFRAVGLEKGIDTMIRALPYLPSDMSMVFVGGIEKYIEEYKELARTLEVSDRCIFIRKQPFANVVRYERALDVLVIPYPNKHHFRDYGFPMKVWEYMASGTPIVYSDLEIIDEVLSKHGTSFVAGDKHALADTVQSVHSEYMNKSNHAMKNREIVLQYTWDMRARHIVDFIKPL